MDAQPDEFARAARLAFQGTVQRVAHGRATVRVDQLVSGPPAALVLGRNVELVLARGESVSRRDIAVFYASGWELGETVVIQSIGHRSPDVVPSQQRRVRRDAGSADADLVVSGTVTRVVPIPSATGHVTEHDPRWHEAVVRIADTQRGTPPGAEVIVRFPASMDVRWHQAPKLSPGETGTFLLRREASEAEQPVFRAVGRVDVAADAAAPIPSSPPPAVKSSRPPPRGTKARRPRRR